MAAANSLGASLGLDAWPAWASGILAARCVWRVLPTLVEHESVFENWADVVQTADVAGCLAGGWAWFEESPPAELFQVVTDHLYSTAPKHQQPLALRAAARTTRAFRSLLTPRVKHANPDQPRFIDHIQAAIDHAANAWPEDDRENFVESVRDDVAWFLDTHNASQDSEFLPDPLELPQAFLSKPLFPNTNNRVWDDAIANLFKHLEAAGQGELVAMFEWLHADDASSFEAMQRRISYWAASHEDLLALASDPDETIDTKTAKIDASEDLPPFPGAGASSETETASNATDAGLAPFTHPAGQGVPAAKGDAPSLVDHLGRTPLVDTLAAMCHSKEQGTPFTIALVGPWGDGKSSVMAQVKQRFERQTLWSLWLQQANNQSTRRPARIKRWLTNKFAFVGPHAQTVLMQHFGVKCLMHALTVWQVTGQGVKQTFQRASKEWWFRSRFDVAWFNAWEYEQIDDASAGLGEAVIHAMDTEQPFWVRWLLLRLPFALQQKRQSLIWLGLAGLVTLVWILLQLYWMFQQHGLDTTLTNIQQTIDALGVAASGTIEQATTDPNAVAEAVNAAPANNATLWPDWLKEMGVPAITLPTIALALWKLWGDPRFVKLRNFVDGGTDTDKQPLIPAVRRHIEALTKARLGGLSQRRLVVFIDDLDRCNPDAIVRSLDAIRLVMDLPHVIVIVAMDAQIALDAVCSENAYGDRGREYLEKIFQLIVHLPKPGTQDLAHFIQNDLFPTPAPAPGSGLGRVVGKDAEGHTSGNESTDGSDAGGLEEPAADDHGVDNVETRNATPDAEQTTRASHPLDANKNDDANASEPTDRSTPTDASEPTPANEPKPQDDPQTGSENQNTENQASQPTSNAAQVWRLGETMQDQPNDAERFLALAHLHGFSNPRLLIRLRNSHRLLRGLLHHQSMDGDAASPVIDDAWLMPSLFWVEQRQQWPSQWSQAMDGALAESLQTDMHGQHRNLATEGVPGDFERALAHVPNHHALLMHHQSVWVDHHNRLDGLLPLAPLAPSGETLASSSTPLPMGTQKALGFVSKTVLPKHFGKTSHATDVEANVATH